MNFNYGIMNGESIDDLRARDEQRTVKIDGWTKYRISQIAKEYEVQQCVVIKAFVQAMLTKYEYDNGFDLKFDDRELLKTHVRMKSAYKRLREKNYELSQKVQSLKTQLNKYQ